jgi:hypothetical protein
VFLSRLGNVTMMHIVFHAKLTICTDATPLGPDVHHDVVSRKNTPLLYVANTAQITNLTLNNSIEGFWRRQFFLMQQLVL